MPSAKSTKSHVEKNMPMLRHTYRTLCARAGERYQLFLFQDHIIACLYEEVLACRRFHDAAEAKPLLLQRVKLTREINEAAGW